MDSSDYISCREEKNEALHLLIRACIARTPLRWNVTRVGVQVRVPGFLNACAEGRDAMGVRCPRCGRSGRHPEVFLREVSERSTISFKTGTTIPLYHYQFHFVGASIRSWRCA